MTSLPLVSLILPIRNEARYIARCLDAVLAQDYPSDCLQVLVVDGMSKDGTREIVAEYTARDSRVILLDNPEGIVPTALNRGLRAASGDVIVRVDGHTLIAPDYVRRCVLALVETGADDVGGPMRAAGESWSAQAIAFATSSPFGVGSAQFHYADRPGWVDTVYMGAYRREVFDRIGLFDEELVRNQDDEFNFRLLRAGGKIWLDPKICSTYYSRSSLHGLWKQYFEYGFWKVRVIQKHRRPASWRHLVPAAFILALLGSAFLSLMLRSPFPLLAVALPYLATSLAVSTGLALRRGGRYLPLLPLAFATMHLAYGFGFIAGIIHFAIVRRRAPTKQHTWTI